MIDRNGERPHDRNAGADSFGKAHDGDFRLCHVRDASSRFNRLTDFRRQLFFEPFHQIIERVRLTCDVAHRRSDRGDMRQSSDDGICTAPDDRGRNLRQRDGLVLYAHETIFGCIERAIGNDFNAVVASKGNEGAHAASPSPIRSLCHISRASAAAASRAAVASAIISE